MEQVIEFLSQQHWVAVALAVFLFLSHILNAIIMGLDALEELLKQFGKSVVWIDKVTNVLSVIVGWLNKILNFMNANKKEKK